jgi:dTDP-4-amino-4,6-dideoxygalactose transaminase
LYIITLDNTAVHKQCFELLRQAKIGVNLHYIPIHLQPYYQALGFKQGDFPNAERYYEKAISLPLYPDLLDEEQAHVVQSITTILQELKQ